MSGVRWRTFERLAPALAEVGRALLYRPDRGEVAILATVNGRGQPRVAPVCPIFCADGVYLSVGAHTPKLRHLTRQPEYALHAQVGADDLEFQISGPIRVLQLTADAAERAAVQAAIPFPSFDVSDPIVELLIERALVVTWPQPGTRGVKQVWRAP